MKSGLLLITIVFASFYCHAQTSVGDSISKIKKLLQGNWVDSSRPYFYSINDSSITIIMNEDNHRADTILWHYRVDTISDWKFKSGWVGYFITAYVVNCKDTNKQHSLDESEPCLPFRETFQMLNKKQLWLLSDYDFPLFLNKKE